MDFERTKTGIYVPVNSAQAQTSTHSPTRRSDGGHWLRSSIEALMVVIQLFTVWVLWLTYENTVIPTRQKELLSEQVAQLEMEKRRVGADIARTRQEAKSAGIALAQQQQELRTLSGEKQRLAGAVTLANKSAANALQAAQLAKLRAKTTADKLDTAQMAMFKQYASYAMAAPQLDYMYARMSKSINDINNESEAETVDKYLERVVREWPNYQKMASDVAASLQDAKGQLFPPSYGAELGAFILEKAKSERCEMPDLDSLRKRYAQDIVSARETRLKEAAEQDAKFFADGLKKGIRYVYTEESKERASNVMEWSIEYGARETLKKSTEEAATRCFERFESVAVAYFEKKGAASTPFPNNIGLY